jgi:hypothetical protein
LNDELIATVDIPAHLTVYITISAAYFCDTGDHSAILKVLFSTDAKTSPVGLVRIDSYKNEFESILSATQNG